MPIKKQPLETKIQAAMAAVRGVKADPENRRSADQAFADLDEYASTQEYPSKETIVAAVQEAQESFREDRYAVAVQHLSRALMQVTRI